MPGTPIEPSSGAPYPGSVETRLAVLEHVTRAHDETLARLERRFDVVDRRFDMIERRLDSIEREHRADFRWMIGAMLAGFGGLLGVMAHGFHWL